MHHPCWVNYEAPKSPLPDYTDGVHKIIETAIEKNDLDFFYRLYLTRMAELSLTGQGKEFIDYAKSALDDSQNSLIMAKGFEAIGNLIDLDFAKCINLLDELEASTRGNELKVWVDQISNLCRAYVSFHDGDFKSSLMHAEVSIASPIKSGTLDPMDKGRLIRLVACIGLITSDVKKIEKCADDILRINNPDNLIVLDHAKSAIKSMQLLVHGEYSQAYDLAKSTIALEEASGRVGIASPFDCKFVVMRCLYEFSMINEALSELVSLRKEAEHNGFKFIAILCDVGEIRILSRIPNSQDKVASKINNLRDRISLNPEYESLTWLVDLSEIFVKNQRKDLGRIEALIERNSENFYIQRVGKSILNKVKLDDLAATEDLPENTTFEVISKNLKLAKFEHKGVKKQNEYLKRALEVGEKAGAREIFLRQDNSMLEAIISLSSERDSLWLESLNRLAIERIKERNLLVEISGEQLTTREIEVLKHLVTENSISEIGQILHISTNTMKTHLRNIYRKLGVDGRGSAAKKAKENLII